jgi:hypothetical protein
MEFYKVKFQNHKYLFLLIILIFIPCFKFEDLKKKMYYDFCNVNESKAAFFIIQDIFNHFDLTKWSDKKCFLLNQNLKNYYVRFDNLEKNNINVYSNFKCADCGKRFKNKSFLNMHYKIFHLSTIQNINTKYYCPSDLCRFINCDRYKYYFSLPFNEAQVSGNYQLLEKYEECNEKLVNFYRQGCMQLLEDCFDLKEEKHYDYYTEFYNNFCMKINCERKSREFDYQSDLSKEGSIWDIVRIVAIYILSIFSFIYILIVWISKYS